MPRWLGGKNFSITLDFKKPLPTKPAKDFVLVGKPIPRMDIPDKVTGRYTYMHDFRVPGMLHGRVIRPPGIGAQLLDVDESSVRGLPGFVKTVRQGNFLGVVATDEWSAIRASQKLEAMWSKWEGLPEQAKLFDVFRRSEIARDEVIRQFPRRGRRAVALNVLRGSAKRAARSPSFFAISLGLAARSTNKENSP